MKTLNEIQAAPQIFRQLEKRSLIFHSSYLYGLFIRSKAGNYRVHISGTGIIYPILRV